MPLHYKSNGSLDMRYSSSKAAMSGSSSSGSYGGGGSSSGGGRSSSGSYGSSAGYSYNPSPSSSYGQSSSSDMHYKKDGSLDMRYTSSRDSYNSGFSTTSSTSIKGSGSGSGSSGLNYKKDGTLDMRYTSSKLASSGSSNAGGQDYYPSSGSSSPSNLHFKKDGSLDMRYTSSKLSVSSGGSGNSSTQQYKKDGSYDMRYNSSKSALARDLGSMSLNSGIPHDIPLTKNGQPDMRTSKAKIWVASQAQGQIDKLPQWLPLRKDGSIDTNKAAARTFLSNSNVLCGQKNVDQRRDYYELKYKEDSKFRECVQSERRQPVEINQKFVIIDPNELVKIMQALQPEVNETTKDQFSSLPDSIKVVDFSKISHIFKDDTAVVLGRGNFGVVYKGVFEGVDVAVKKLHLNQLTRKEESGFIKELKILGSLGHHPNLVELKGYTKSTPAIIMEFVANGSLSHMLHYNNDPQIEAKITDGRVKKIICQGIVNGLMQLHMVKIIHGDIKPQNVLITKDFQAKITDFGLATLRGKTGSSVQSTCFDDGETAIGGTGAYMAPELVDSSSKPDFSCDVYSFGVLLNEIVTEEEPYSDQYANFLGRGPFGAANYARLGNRPRIDKKNTRQHLINLIEQCWFSWAGKRPNFEEIMDKLIEKSFTFPNSFGEK